MKRITATLLVFSALTAPALAETPTDRDMHSWGYVQQVANPPVQAEAPVAEHHEGHYYHHEAESGKGAHHHGKHHHDGAKHEGKHAGHHHHHHHKKDAAKEAPKDQQK